MEEILLFIEEQQNWIYVLFTLAGLVYLRLIFQSYRELRRSFFGLERERATMKLMRSGAMLALVFAGLIATFVIATFAGPALPTSIRQIALPTVSLLATPEESFDAVEEGVATVTPLDSLVLDSSGCLNPEATITSPQNDDSISGVVRILGTAKISNFAFFKIEYRSLTSDAAWLAISAGTQPVCEEGCIEAEELGTWDTSLVTPGLYAFRLVVTDTAGNAPLPCVIQLRVLPAP